MAPLVPLHQNESAVVAPLVPLHQNDSAVVVASFVPPCQNDSAVVVASLVPPHQNNDDADGGSAGDRELQQAINATFSVAQQSGQSERILGGKRHHMMSDAMNAVDVMNYNPNVPINLEYR